MPNTSLMAQQVRHQYEAYPYPVRELDADHRLVQGLSPLEHLLVISAFAYRGRWDLSAARRILVAGGGTGDASTILGWQMQQMGVPGEIVYLDLSEASRAIAMERAKRLGLTNIEFIRGSLLDVATMGLGEFDYINCSGVIHHLKRPSEGLRALGRVLAPNGVMGVMVYGELGRSGIYSAQEIIGLLAAERPLERQIEVARRVLGSLPPTNLLRRNPSQGSFDTLTDAEIVDRFLHVQDRAYRVPEILELVDAAELEVVEFVPPLLYDPSVFVQNRELAGAVAGLSRFERYRFTELWMGTVARHSLFIAKPGLTVHGVATIDSTLVPRFLVGNGAAAAGNRQAAKLTLGGAVLTYPLRLSTLQRQILLAIDGKRTLGDIHRAVADAISWDAFASAFEPVYRIYNGACVLVLTR